MKYIYALIAGVATRFVVLPLVAMLDIDKNVNDFGFWVFGVASGALVTSTLLFIDKIKNK
ncbi:MAG: hypothetical protein WDZ40_00325 [Candidatus Spechtbacterales bacterium]